MRLRTLLVDDEPLALERLQGLLKSDGGLEIIGTCSSGLDALESIRQLKPDLVFLDIQMPELDGFEVLEALDCDEMPLVVFVTAFDRYAIRAFEARALDYLLKPFSSERLRETVERVKEAKLTRDAQGRLHELLRDIEFRQKDRFVVRRGDRFLVISASEVEAIEAEGNYMWIHRGKEAFPLRATLATLEKNLNPDFFIRTHRSWIMNIRRIRELAPGAKGGLVAVTSSGMHAPVSAKHRKQFEEQLSQLGFFQKI